MTIPDEIAIPSVAGTNIIPDEVAIPVGLEYLTEVDQLLIDQKIGAWAGCEAKNRYSIKNSLGQEIYSAKEDSEVCAVQCCGIGRAFDLNIFDNFNRRVIRLNRPLLCLRCLNELTVHDNFGNILGRITDQSSIFHPLFKVKNANDEIVLRIEGPACTPNLCCNDVKFKVLSRDSTVQVGTICRRWIGLFNEFLTNRDHFYISFPMDLDVNIKAVLLGAVFLIDYSYFERNK